MADTYTMTTPINEAGDCRTELVPPADPRACFVSVDADRLGGVPCFVRTRVPIKYLWEYLLKGYTLDAFLDDFDGVPRDAAIAALQQSYERLMAGLPQP
jgi:uncharacterized protein (DUF433 family)